MSRHSSGFDLIQASRAKHVEAARMARAVKEVDAPARAPAPESNHVDLNTTEHTPPPPAEQLATRWIGRRYGLTPSTAEVIADAAALGRAPT